MRHGTLPQILACALIGSIGFAQWTPDFGSSQGSSYSLTEPYAYAEAFGATTALHLDDDGLIDMGCLLGSELQVLFGPGLLEALEEDLAQGVNDLTALRSLSLEEIVVVGQPGVGAIRWLGTGFGSRLLAGGAWQGARAIDSVSTPPGAPARFYGLLADGIRVCHLYEDPDDEVHPWRSQLIYTSPVPVLDVVLANVDGLGDPEIGLRLGNGFMVIDTDGVPRSSGSYPVTTDVMTMLPGPGAQQWLALFATDIYGINGFLSVIGPNGLAVADDLLGNPIVVGAAAGDFGPEDESLTDLVISIQSMKELVHLENLSEAQTPFFDLTQEGGATLLSLGPSGPHPGNLATPVVADLDNDGDPDVCHPFQADGTFKVFMSARAQDSSTKPSLLQDPMPRYVLESGTVELRAKVVLDREAVTEGEPTHLDVSVFRRASPAAPVAVNPVCYQRIDLDDFTTLGSFEHYNLVLPFNEPPIEEGGCTHFDALFFVVLRMLSVDSSALTTAWFPASVYGVEGQYELEVNSDFLNEHDGGDGADLEIEHACTVHLPGQSTRIGGWGDELPSLPGPTEGGPPKLSPPP